jgi:acyl-homoserine lactone acylase PvdQ
MKIFIDPADMKAQYEKSPAWLKSLMNAWADGLNYYLHTHPQVRPRVIKHFEPWMALTFSEGSTRSQSRCPRMSNPPVRTVLPSRLRTPPVIIRSC